MKPMLMPGDWVRVRSAEEVASTLDADGCFEGLPFMPEMARHCGACFQVQMRAELTCTFPYVGHRRLEHAVVLHSLRCDGADHAGCQLGCTIFWNERWLQPVGESTPLAAGSDQASPEFRSRRREDPARYICQGTELVRITKPAASKWEPTQYVRLIRGGTLKPLDVAGLFAEVARRRVLGLLRGARTHLPRNHTGAADDTPAPTPAPRPVPTAPLRLKTGDLVKVKGEGDILATLDERGTLRGLPFSVTMVKYCGKTLKVAAAVDRIIDERTGKVREFAPGTVLLEGVLCNCYRGCARNLPMMWREAWLDRVEGVDTRAPRAERAAADQQA